MARDSKGNGYSLQSTQDIELRIYGPIFSNFLSLGLRNCMDFTILLAVALPLFMAIQLIVGKRTIRAGVR